MLWRRACTGCVRVWASWLRHDRRPRIKCVRMFISSNTSDDWGRSPTTQLRAAQGLLAHRPMLLTSTKVIRLRPRPKPSPSTDITGIPSNFSANIALANECQVTNGIHVLVSTCRLCGLKAKYKYKYSSLKAKAKAKHWHHCHRLEKSRETASNVPQRMPMKKKIQQQKNVHLSESQIGRAASL